MKLWSGRFGKETDALVNDFNASIQFDSRLYREDIEGSIAHAAMGEGDASCTCWGCDITYDYIKINGDYRT